MNIQNNQPRVPVGSANRPQNTFPIPQTSATANTARLAMTQLSHGQTPASRTSSPPRVSVGAAITNLTGQPTPVAQRISGQGIVFATSRISGERAPHHSSFNRPPHFRD